MSGEVAFEWRLTPHICRVCFGRVVSRYEGGRNIYRCANCGVERAGADESAICTCGMRLNTGKDAGVRCVINEHPTPQFPSEVVAEQVGCKG